MWIIYNIVFYYYQSLSRYKSIIVKKRERGKRKEKIEFERIFKRERLNIKLFYNLYVINTGGHCYNRLDFNFIVDGGKTGFSDKEGRAIVPQNLMLLELLKGILYCYGYRREI